jgi:hypothetical protein
MKHSEPLFISSAEMDRHCKAAKELRSQYLRDIAEGIRRKIMPQKQAWFLWRPSSWLRSW